MSLSKPTLRLTALAWVVGFAALSLQTAPAADVPAAPKSAAPPKATAAPAVAQIIDKHIAARGGATAWRAVQSLRLSGKLEAGLGDANLRAERLMRAGKPDANAKPGAAAAASAAATPGDDAAADKQILLPFTLSAKRPHKSRLEIEFGGKTAVQTFDGTHGWKWRPFLNRPDAEPFTADEDKTEATHDELDGPLIDYVAKGTHVVMEKVEPVEGHNAYKLKLTLKDGSVRHVWIDAASYLDVKVEGAPQQMDGRAHAVWVYQRDFRQVQGVMIPFVLETAVDGYPDTHKMVVEKADINPALSDSLFTKPQT